MKALVVYDSVYGNTEQIAQAIGKALNIELVRANDVKADQLTELKLLIIGSPTHGGRFTEAIQDFLNGISELTVGINVAAFDTRTSSRNFILRAFEKIFGHAAGRIADIVKRHGGILIAEPEGFIVKGTKGPLKEGELERAESWAKDIAENKQSIV
ncbi:MAG: flavodoxin family protein [Candidatus Odinarchaeota archaeon]